MADTSEPRRPQFTEGFFRDLTSLGVDIVTVLDPEGVIVYESQAIVEMLGYDPEELVGQPVLDLVHPDDREHAAERLGQLYAGADRAAAEVRFRHRDGSWRWIEGAGRRWEFEGRPHVLINTRDVTERRRMVAELARSNELLTKTLRASRNIVSITRIDTGEYLEVNDEWLNATGFTRDQVVGHTSYELGVWGNPENRDRVIADLRAAGGRLRDYEVQTYTLRGPRTFIFNIEPLTISDEPLMLMAGTDVTESRLTEAKLRHAQKMEAVGQLTGGVAHDFNNLLGIIMGNAELLKGALESRDDLMPLVDVILQATERGANVTGQLLAFSRRQVLAPRPIALAAAVGDMLPLLRTTLGPNLHLWFDAPGNLPRALVDPGQLENALLNLVVNARDAMPDGGTVCIRIEARDVTGESGQEEGELAPGAYVALSVIDQGEGMDEAAVSRAFEPFFTTKETGQGTGLGLSMVFGFARQSGGMAMLQSRPGEGTRATILLPAAAPVMERTGHDSREADRVPDPAGRGETVVVLEDEPSLGELMARQLGHLGYDVRVARDERELDAILAAVEDVDLLISDVFLTGPRNGPDVVRGVREQWPDVPVLYVSGYPADQLAATPDAPLLAKPFSRSRLAHAVRSVLDDCD